MTSQWLFAVSYSPLTEGFRGRYSVDASPYSANSTAWMKCFTCRLFLKNVKMETLGATDRVLFFFLFFSPARRRHRCVFYPCHTPPRSWPILPLSHYHNRQLLRRNATAGNMARAEFLAGHPPSTFSSEHPSISSIRSHTEIHHSLIISYRLPLFILFTMDTSNIRYGPHSLPGADSSLIQLSLDRDVNKEANLQQGCAAIVREDFVDHYLGHSHYPNGDENINTCLIHKNTETVMMDPHSECSLMLE